MAKLDRQKHIILAYKWKKTGRIESKTAAITNILLIQNVNGTTHDWCVVIKSSRRGFLTVLSCKWVKENSKTRPTCVQNLMIFFGIIHRCWKRKWLYNDWLMIIWQQKVVFPSRKLTALESNEKRPFSLCTRP